MLHQLVFLGVVTLLFRLEYLLARSVCRKTMPCWGENKIRLFSVRVVSLTHAFFSSIAVLTSLTDPRFIKSPYDFFKEETQFVFLFSMGYFLYDLFDMGIHGELPNSKEYILHHSLALFAFSSIIVSEKFFGVAVIGLLVEVQTVFLHSRTIVRLLIKGSEESVMSEFFIQMNMICLFLFRHAPTLWLLYFLMIVDEKCGVAVKLIVCGSLLFLEAHNLHLTQSIAKSDGFFGFERQKLDEDTVDPLGSVRTSECEKIKKTGGFTRKMRKVF
ncbi:hypothetical protein CRE_23037 [Caenorhabditis remanei]|uniref:TLC domain-containing protein n=1 Tax=Caenorhabditis remanei TaxID=31234 RepID=E3N4H3_CAERE|nr:hypothetical protein CRE_23037 [Caenorhabditis remanei]